ncbi:MAG: DNA repair protein RecN [Fusobacteriaceae bacterium]|jgi:DNA repair protein RecN (Recombination protein N)|nr:DNA repair protein RecN [Fusobacteriaceae bacterium]
MLKELKIENLAIIKSVSLEFDNGLIVLTGETGAGKSIILSGINLLIGEKATFDMIRKGEENLIAEGVFSLDEEKKKEIEKLGILLFDEDLIVRRIYDKDGKGKAFVNNVRVTLNALKDIARNLIDIVGQHSHQMLLNKSNHIKLLDKFLGDGGKKQRIKINNLYEKYNEIIAQIENTERLRKETVEKKELYDFQLNEINTVNPVIDEDISLEEEYKKAFNAEMIKEKLINSRFLIRENDKNILNQINNLIKNIEGIAKYDDEYTNILKRVEEVYYELEDCDDILKTFENSIEIDEKSLLYMSERLDAITKLKLKYGSTIGEILEFRDAISKKVKTFDESQYLIDTLLLEREQIKKEYYEEAKILSDMRFIKSNEIKILLEEELKQLQMEDTTFEVRIEKRDDILYNGVDDVEFFISTNIGQDVKPLWKIASGGEVSRIMLALKVIFSKIDNIPILIFDEIDTGVGGETIRKIANKLKDIGSHTQVISITHSPVIASKANEQLYIKKETIDNQTTTTVTKLNKEERVKEIARMLAGDRITDSVIEHAKELLN